MTEEEFREIVRQRGAGLESLFGRMQAYNANINGCPAYMHQKKKQLEAMIEQLGMCSLWFSFSMADNYWHELYRILNHVARDFANEMEEAKFRRKLVRDNPHIVDYFFNLRLKAMLETFFGPQGFESDWHWFRFELQGRGAYHAHGCLRLKHDPGFKALGDIVYKGRRAQKIVELNKLDLQTKFSTEQTCDDDWGDLVNQEEFTRKDNWSVEEKDQNQAEVTAGILAEAKILAYQTLLVSTMHPHPPVDATADQRCDSTTFVQTATNVHPAAIDVRTLLAQNDIESLLDYLAKLLDAVERHSHQNYCQKGNKKRKRKRGADPAPPAAGDEQGHDHAEPHQQHEHPDQHSHETAGPGREQNEKCRFDFPKRLCKLGHIVIHRYSVQKKGDTEKTYRVQLEIMPKRNDKWLNSHNPHLMMDWCANCDMQLTIDLGKVVGYMTKYVTKCEASMTKGSQRMLEQLLQRSVENGYSVPRSLKMMMGRLQGERQVTKQEVCHLGLSQPTVSCSHSFLTINLANDSRKLLLPSEEDEEAVGDTENAVAAATSTTKMTIVDVYAVRLEEKYWLDKCHFDQVEDKLPEMTLRDFAAQYTVGEKRNHRNKIKLRPNKKLVIVFRPELRCQKQHKEQYIKYCRFSLMKYVPWAGKLNSLWGGDDVDENVEIPKAWENHLKYLEEQDMQLPDFLQRQLDDFHSCGNTFGPRNDEYDDSYDPDDVVLEEWQYVQNDHVFHGDDENIDTDCIQWDREHNWNVCENEYSDDFLQQSSLTYTGMLANFAPEICAAPEPDVTLNERQEYGQRMIIGLVDRAYDSEEGTKLGILIGKGGTGKSTTIGAAEYALEQKSGVGCVLKLATTGKAASVINGSTLHSRKKWVGCPRR